MDPTPLALSIMVKFPAHKPSSRSAVWGDPISRRSLARGVQEGLFWAQAATLPSQWQLTLPTAFTLHWCCYLPPSSIMGPSELSGHDGLLEIRLT